MNKYKRPTFFSKMLNLDCRDLKTQVLTSTVTASSVNDIFLVLIQVWSATRDVQLRQGGNTQKPWRFVWRESVTEN